MDFIDSLSFILSQYPHTVIENSNPEDYLFYLHTSPPITIHCYLEIIFDPDIIKEALTDPDFVYVEDYDYYIHISCLNKSYSNTFFTIGDIQDFIYSTLSHIL